MNKRQWFQGRLDGQYVGGPKARQKSGGGRGGEAFDLKITRAVISEVLLGPLATERAPVEAALATDLSPTEPVPVESLAEPTHHHVGEGDRFHQASISQVFFLEAMGPGRTVRSGAHDVFVSEVELTDAARHEGRIYGRMRGVASGWFRPLPPLVTPVDVLAPERPGEVWRSEVQVSPPAAPEVPSPSSKSSGSAPQEQKSSMVRSPHKESLASADASSDSAEARLDDDAPGFIPGSVTAYAETDLPFLTIGTLLAVGMFVVAGWFAALAWYASFLPALGLRRWLYGIIPEGWATRAFSIAVAAVQLLVAILVIAGWQESGCKSLNPFILALLVCGQYVCCLLPRAPAFACTAGALAAVIAQFYGPFGSICP